MSEEIKKNSPEEAEKPAKKEKKAVSKNPFKSKKFKHGSLSVVFTVIFVAVIVLLNIILNLVLDRFDVEVDLTDGGIYTMGEEMENYVENSADHVSFYFTADAETLESAGSVYKQTMEFAENAADKNSNYTVEYVDLFSDPDFSSAYEGVKEGGLIIECEETGRYRYFDIGNDFLQYKLDDGNAYSYSEAYMMSMYGYSVVDTVSIAEQELLSGLMSVTKVNPVKVGVTTGFGESVNADLTGLLEKNTYVVETVNIDMVEAVSEEYDILIVNGPTMDYSTDALNKIDSWLSNGGMYGKNLIYFATTSEVVDTPNLDDFLAEWGLEIGDGFVCQRDPDYAYAVSGYTYHPLYQRAEIVTDTDYYKAMQLDPNMSFRANAVRPVKKLWEEQSNFVNTTIVQTYGEDCAIFPFSAENDEEWSLETAEETGQFGIIVEASKVRYDGVTPYYSRVIAAGSESLFTSTFLSATNYNNAEVAISIFNTISGNAGESVTITPKSFTATTYEIQASQQYGIGITFAVVIPVIIIVAGIIVWVRRKRL